MRFLHFDKETVRTLLDSLAEKMKVPSRDLHIFRIKDRICIAYGAGVWQAWGFGHSITEAIMRFYVHWLQRNN